MVIDGSGCRAKVVAPARGRGLKSYNQLGSGYVNMSPPQGGVD